MVSINKEEFLLKLINLYQKDPPIKKASTRKWIRGVYSPDIGDTIERYLEARENADVKKLRKEFKLLEALIYAGGMGSEFHIMQFNEGINTTPWQYIRKPTPGDDKDKIRYEKEHKEVYEGLEEDGKRKVAKNFRHYIKDEKGELEKIAATHLLKERINTNPEYAQYLVKEGFFTEEELEEIKKD